MYKVGPENKIANVWYIVHHCEVCQTHHFRNWIYFCHQM